MSIPLITIKTNKIINMETNKVIKLKHTTMETKKAFEAFENAMIEALRADVISIERTTIDEDGSAELWVNVDYPCMNLLFEIYRKAKDTRNGRSFRY